MSAPSAATLVSWEAQGRQAATRLDGVNSVVIAGRDAAAAASYAIGIARVHGATRRVALADLVGELAPLQSLVNIEDPHGISDSFLYGVSLNKIAVPIDGSSNVFLMPSGTEAVAIESVYNNERWRRLAAGFHQVGALLLIVASPDVPGFNNLCEFAGAVLPVGDVVFALPDSVNVLAERRPTPPPTERTAARALAAAAEDPAMRRRKLIVITIALLAGAIAVGTAWPKIVTSFPSRVSKEKIPAPDTSNDAPRASTQPNSAPPPNSATPPNGAPAAQSANAQTPPVSPSGAAASDGATEAFVPANPQDSLHATVFSVYVNAGKSARDAMPDARAQNMPVVTVSPVLLGADLAQWFRATVGATDDITQAQSILARLRVAKVLGESSGSIIRVPYALRLAESVSLDSAPLVVRNFGKRGVAAYALQQKNGRAVVYTGAYESPEQALWLADSLRVAGIPPVLVFRTGRAF